MVNSSRSLVTVMRVFTAPSLSSCSRTAVTTVGRSPESMRTAPSSGPATCTASSTPRVMSYVSMSSVVLGPKASTWARNAASSLSCSSVNACAAVPMVGMPHVRPASRFDVASNPEM